MIYALCTQAVQEPHADEGPARGGVGLPGGADGRHAALHAAQAAAQAHRRRVAPLRVHHRRAKGETNPLPPPHNNGSEKVHLGRPF